MWDEKMRDILYKAKRIDTGEWVKGSYVYFSGTHSIQDPEVHWSKTIDPKTRCQYTESNDLNGHLIWEYDFVREMGAPNNIALIKFEDSAFKYCWCLLDVKTYMGSIESRLKMEKIGNMFDNPELMLIGK